MRDRSARLPWPAARRGVILALCLIFTFGPRAGLATQPGAARPLPQLCDQAAMTVARETGVPVNALLALTRTETGRRIAGETQPWPWTVNMEGESHWFATRAEALTFTRARQASGAESFDIGCFQINHYWHGDQFTSLEQMFDPVTNARYAARFLADLYREFGDWEGAAGAYHSRTPDHAARYLRTYRTHLAALGDAPSGGAAPRAATLAPRVNSFPLLQAGLGGARGLGSLVPQVQAPAGRLAGGRP